MIDIDPATHWSSLRTAVLVALVPFFIVACGGGSSDGPPPMVAVPDFLVTLVAGSGSPAFGYNDGPGLLARFASATTMTADDSGNVFVSDDTAIRKVAPDGTVTTFAGELPRDPANQEQLDGLGSAARFNFVKDLFFDRGRNSILVLDGDSIRNISASGNVTTRIAGLRPAPNQVTAAPDGTIYFSAGFTEGGRIPTAIYKLAVGAASATLLAGSPNLAEMPVDGAGAIARFNIAWNLVADALGNVYVASGSVRRIAPDGTVTTLAKHELFPIGIDNLTFEASGNLITRDAASGLISRVTPAGEVSTIARISARDKAVVYDQVIDPAGRLYVLVGRSWLGRTEKLPD